MEIKVLANGIIELSQIFFLLHHAGHVRQQDGIKTQPWRQTAWFNSQFNIWATLELSLSVSFL